MMLEWLKEVPESLVPLPREVWQSTAQRTAALYLPVMADPGRCQTHSQYTLSRVLEGDSWALAMLDASSRPMPGLLEGRIADLGDYDQCLRIKEPQNQFSAQHCLVDIKNVLSSHMFEPIFRVAVNKTFPMCYISMSLCVPSSCTTEDVNTHVHRILQAANLTLPPGSAIETYSSMDRPALRLKDKIAIAVFGSIAVFVVFSTAYDWNISGSKSEVLSSFSILKGWRELTDNSATPAISCLDGIRLLCAFAVLVTHRFLLYYFVPYINFATYLEQRSGMLYAIVGSGSMATETFFLINGVTRAYSFLKARREGKPSNHLYQSIQRYFKFTPVVAVVVLFTSTLAIHTSDGPIWLRCMGYDEELCKYLWILNLLQLNNWFLYKCRIETWFISSDFQLYLLSPLVLNILHDKPKKGVITLAVIFVACIFSKITTSYFSLLYPDIITNIGAYPERDFSSAHSNTFFRTPPYILGIIIAYILHNNTYGVRKLSLSKCTVWMGWLTSAGVILATPLLHSIFFQPDYEDNPWLSVLYVGIWELLFAASVGWIILACTLGYGGWVNQVLSLSALRPLAKLSFGLYLTHMSFQTIMVLRMRQPLDFNTLDTLHLCCADIVIAFLLGTVMYLAVETPCNRLVSHLLRHKLSPGKHKTKDK